MYGFRKRWRVAAAMAAMGLGVFGLALAPSAAQATATITVASPGNLTSYDGDAVYLQIRASDSQAGVTVSYSAAGLPDGLSINSRSGVISGFPTLAADVGGAGYSPEITVTDSAGASASVSFSWDIGATATYDPAGPMRSAFGGKCLDDRNASTASGNPIQLWQCNNSAAQDVSLGNFNSIQVMGRCVDDGGDTQGTGTPVRLEPCNNGNNQLWLLYPNGGVAGTGVNCIGAPGSANGTRLRVENCDPYSTTPPQGMRWLAPATSSTLVLDGKCLDSDWPFGSGPFPGNGSKAQQWPCNGSWSQDWTLEPLGWLSNGQPAYAIGLTFGGSCLDVRNAGVTNGTKVQMWQCNYDTAQTWTFEGGHLVNPHSGKCLDDPYSRTASGTQLDIWTCNGGRNQQWPTPPAPVTAEIPGTCLANNAPGNGGAVEVLSCRSGQAGQLWSFQPDGTVRTEGDCLDVVGGSGPRVQLWNCIRGDGNQQWRQLSHGRLENPHSGKCLAFPGTTPATGVRLVIQACAAAGTITGQDWHTQ